MDFVAYNCPLVKLELGNRVHSSQEQLKNPSHRTNLNPANWPMRVTTESSSLHINPHKPLPHEYFSETALKILLVVQWIVTEAYVARMSCFICKCVIFTSRFYHSSLGGGYIPANAHQPLVGGRFVPLRLLLYKSEPKDLSQ